MKDVVSGLDAGAIETLIVWEEFEHKRITVHNPHTDLKETVYVTEAGAKDPKLYRDKDSGVELDIIENEPFVEWIVSNYKTFGTKLQFVSDRSSEGNQFCKGFGGIGGVMRYRVEFEMYDETGIHEDSDDDFM